MGLAQQPLGGFRGIDTAVRIVRAAELCRFLPVCLLVAMLLVGHGELRCREGAATQAESLEYRVKAAFLLNFTKFTEWPESAFVDAKTPLSICILGSDPFGHVLDQTIEGEVVNSRKLVVQRIQSPPAAKACQVLFAARLEEGTSQILSTVGPGVLTVGEDETFVRGGGMIRFLIEAGRVRFDINQTAAEAAGLKLSSKLLKVARLVKQKPLE